ncbi:MAG: hypothetical protein KBS59_03010 [Clostridiales bacterium]|nr:hypothetical protein [Clostridiales bacterium]
MTNVERFNAAFGFEKADRLPIIEWAAWWGDTLNKWYEQGLTREYSWDRLQNYFGLDYMRRIWMPLEKRGCPRPETHGAPLIFDESEYESFRDKYLFPSQDDEGYKAKMAQLLSLKEEHDRGDAIVWFSYDGFFWFPRTLLGIENHLYSFYDYPELYHKICTDLCDYIISNLDALFGVLSPEFFVISEDMSYNNGPMISEELFDEFLLPYYNKLIPELHRRGCKVIIDTDGDVSMMIPWLIRAGIDGVLPLERQAGVDICALREKYPDFLFLGGFDKMTMPRGEEAMRAEFERLLPAMRSGGYIPSVDHQTPPGVSLENFRIYVELLKEYAYKAME